MAYRSQDEVHISQETIREQGWQCSAGSIFQQDQQERGSQLMTARRVLRLRPNAQARLRLICFPSAGYGASMYRDWASSFPHDIEVIGVHLPGREALRQLPLIDDLPALSRDVRVGIQSYLDRPFAFFGHSMGAWIALDVARMLRREEAQLPMHLFVSGRRAPQTPERHPQLHELADDELIANVQERFGGIPQAVLVEAELMQLLLPILRSDLRAVETYPYASEPALPIPISAFGGRDDDQVLPSELQAWNHHTQQSFRFQVFPGGHFYLNETSHAPLLRAVQDELVQHLRTDEGSMDSDKASRQT